MSLSHVTLFTLRFYFEVRRNSISDESVLNTDLTSGESNRLLSRKMMSGESNRLTCR